MRAVKKETKKKEEVVEEQFTCTEEELDSLIPKFYDNNETKKASTKVYDALGKSIKELMSKSGITERFVNGIKAVYSTSKTVGFDEDVLIDILKEKLPKEQLNKIVKKKEYVDYDSLDNALYNQEFDAIILKKAQTIKETIKLVVNKAKTTDQLL